MWPHVLVVWRKNDDYFRINDRIRHPATYTEKMSVRISFSWRRKATDEWNLGRIEFLHDYDSRFRSEFSSNKTNTRNSIKQKDASLYDEWVYLRDLGLFAVSEYFKSGKDGAKIPNSFIALTEGEPRRLNNKSLKFW